MFLLNIFFVYEKLKILCANIWGLPYIEIQLNQARLKSAKWTIEIEHTKSF